MFANFNMWKRMPMFTYQCTGSIHYHGEWNEVWPSSENCPLQRHEFEVEHNKYSERKVFRLQKDLETI